MNASPWKSSFKNSPFADSYRYQWRCSVACSGAKGRLAHCAHLRLEGASFFVKHAIVWHTAISAICGDVDDIGDSGALDSSSHVTGDCLGMITWTTSTWEFEAAEANEVANLQKWALASEACAAQVAVEISELIHGIGDRRDEGRKDHHGRHDHHDVEKAFNLIARRHLEDSLLVNFVNRGGKMDSDLNGKELITVRAFSLTDPKLQNEWFKHSFQAQDLEHVTPQPSRRCCRVAGCLFNPVCFHLKCQQRLATQEDRYQKISHLDCHAFIPIPWRCFCVATILFQSFTLKANHIDLFSCGSQIDHVQTQMMTLVQTWMDLFGYKGSPSHAWHTSMDAGVNWVRDQWRDVKYLGLCVCRCEVAAGMDQNGRSEHVELHANQSNHLGFRSKKSARKMGFQKGFQHVSEVSNIPWIQVSDLHRKDMRWKSRSIVSTHWIWSYHDPLGTKWCYLRITIRQKKP